MYFPVQRRWIAIAALCLGPVVTVTAAPEWVRETAKDILAYPDAEKEIRDLNQKREEYQQEINHILRRCEIKSSILDKLEAGQITLFDAAKHFRELDRNSRVLSALIYSPDRSGSIDEIAAITVIRQMQARYGGDQPILSGTLARLESEFETAYGYRPE